MERALGNLSTSEEVRLVIWDLDDTFWKGTLAEGPIEYVQANHDLVIELSKRGIVNSICSKNIFENAKAVLEDAEIWPYFIFPLINWEPKGPVIEKLIKEIQLRPENVLFIDDNPLNLEDAKFYVPGIQVASPLNIDGMLGLTSFQGKYDPDLSRLHHYKILETKQSDKNLAVNSNADFLRQCDIKVTIKENCLSEKDRILELINRTNQLNFTKVRLDEENLLSLFNDINIETRYLHVVDRYGDYGVCGFYSLQGGQLQHFLFSCRVMNMGIEDWIYHKLGKPHISIQGEVASSLENKMPPDWIREVAEISPSVKTRRSFPKHRILIKGGCDLEQLSTYLTDSFRIETEYNYPSETGFPIHTEHTEILKRCNSGTLECFAEVIDRLPFLNRNAYRTNFFQRRWGIRVYSILMDYTQGLYRYQNTSLIVPFGDFLIDITQSTHWMRYLQKYEDKGIDENFFYWFAENFVFMGGMSAQELSENLEWMRRRIPQDRQLIILNASEVKIMHDFETNRWQHHHALNQVVDNFVKTHEENTKLCDVRKHVRFCQDVTDNIRHYNRERYLDIADELIAILMDCSVVEESQVSKIIRSLGLGRRSG